MITSTKKLERYCTEYQNIENYTEAVKSPIKYDLHHRLEIDEMQSRSDLIFLQLYYPRPPEALIFLEHGEHIRLHNAKLSEDTRQRLSEALTGDKNPMFGKHPSAESRQKMSDALKGHLVSVETKRKMSENNCRYWKDKNLSAETKRKMS